MDKKQGGRIDVDELTERIVGLIGLEDPEKIIVKQELEAPMVMATRSSNHNSRPAVTPEMVQQMILRLCRQMKQD
jgi:hypothetical protein